MSKKRERFKARRIQRGDLRAFAYLAGDEKLPITLALRVADARDLTPEQAVRKVLQKVYSVHDSQTFIEHPARLVGMTAYLADGTVCMRRSKT